jgi:hypothetical protein
MTITKTELKKALVAERKSMREKQKQSLFMRRTLSIYNGMKKRAAELGKVFDLTLDELRNGMKPWIGSECIYCDARLTINNITVDHSTPISRGGTFGLENLDFPCKPCNWQKGIMCAGEFIYFRSALGPFADEVQTDIKRRLTIGGKWGVRVS